MWGRATNPRNALAIRAECQPAIYSRDLARDPREISLRANADPVQLSELRLVYVSVDSLTCSLPRSSIPNIYIFVSDPAP